MSETPSSGAPHSAPVIVQIARPSSNTGLDYILILGVLGLVFFGVYGLMYGHLAKDSPAIPIIASVVTGCITGILGLYAGYRWAASDAQKSRAVGAAQ